MRGFVFLWVALVLVASAVAEIGVWETRGDSFFQARRYEKAMTAYKTALGQDPRNPRILKKYQRALLRVYATGGAPESSGGGVSRMGGTKSSKKRRYSGVSRMGGVRPTGRRRQAQDEASDQAVDGEEAPSEAPPEGEASLGEGTPEASGEDPETGEEEGEEDEVDEEAKKEELEEMRWRREREQRMLDRIPALSRLGRTPSRSSRRSDDGRRVYGGSQNVELDRVRQGNESGEDAAPETSVVETTKYRIDGITLSYKGSNLHVSGTVTNISSGLIKLPRVYCRIYDEAGLLRGRNFSYLSPGRNNIARGKTKKFDVVFRGYTGTVSSYQFEVIP